MNVKKILSILLVITIMLPLCTVFVGAQSNAVSEDSQTVGINYDIINVIITGTVDGNAIQGYFIDLTNETITVPSDYKITAYSINDGKSWTSVGKKIFNNDTLIKLFSKDFTLVLTDKYNSKTKKPADGAQTLKFATVHKRPTLKSYSANYLIGADPTGETTGTWVLTEKNGTKSIKENIEIAAADSTEKAPDSKGYGKFYGKDGTKNGIAITELSDNGKAVSNVYFIRNAASANSDGTYTAASKSSKITVKGQSKPSTYQVNKTKKKISYAANTYIYTDKVELKKSKGDIDVSAGGAIYLWSAATEKVPASAMQKTSVTPGEKAITYTNSTVTKIPKAVVEAVVENDNVSKASENSYIKGSKNPFTFTVEKDFSTFEDIAVDGKTLVKGEDYTIQPVFTPTKEEDNAVQPNSTEAKEDNVIQLESTTTEEDNIVQTDSEPIKEESATVQTEPTTTRGEENIIQLTSTIITLSENFLNGLAANEYSLSVNFTDGSVMQTFTVVEPKAPVEESKTPVEEPTAYATEPRSNKVEESKTKTEEPETQVMANPADLPIDFAPFAATGTPIISGGPTVLTIGGMTASTFSISFADGSTLDSSDIIKWDFVPFPVNSAIAIQFLGVGTEDEIKANAICLLQGIKVGIGYLSVSVNGTPSLPTLITVMDTTVPPPNPPPDLEIVVPPISEEEIGIGDAEVGTGYSLTFKAKGGVKADPNNNDGWSVSSIYKWELVIDGTVKDDGKLGDTGLIFKDGVITGTPTKGGSYSFSIKLSDEVPRSITVGFTIMIWDRFNITFGIGDGKGKITAQNKTDQGKLLRTEETNSGDKNISIRMSSDAFFTAVPDQGYQIEQWTVIKKETVPDPDDSLKNIEQEIQYVVYLQNGNAILVKSTATPPTTGATLYTRDEYNLIKLTGDIIKVTVVFKPNPIAITTTSLPDGKLGHPTSYPHGATGNVLQGTGLVGTARWSIVTTKVKEDLTTGELKEDAAAGTLQGDTLPPNLVLNPTTGAITGQIDENAVAKEYKFYVKLEDRVNNNNATRVSVIKEIKFIIRDHAEVIYKIDDVKNGTIAVEYTLMNRVFPQDDGSLLINAWENDTIAFIARPNPGYVVKSEDWKPYSSTDNSSPITLTGTKTNTASEYRYTVTSITGTITNSGPPPVTKTATLKVLTVKFSPQTVYRVLFSVVGGNGDVKGTLNGATYITNSDVSNGSVILTAIPDNGYQVKNWKMIPAWVTTAQPANVVSTGVSYTVPPPPPPISPNPPYLYVIVTVEFEPKGAAGTPKIVKLPTEDGTAFFISDATVGIPYEAELGITGVEYAYAIWSFTYVSPTTGTADYPFKMEPMEPNIGKTTTLSINAKKSGLVTIKVKAEVYSTANSLLGTVTRDLTLNVLAPKPLVITPTLPDGVEGFSYEAYIQYTGSTATNWELVPNTGTIGIDGLTFEESVPDIVTGEVRAKISGIPTKDGTYTFTVKGTNAAGDTIETITLTIHKASPPTNIQPTTLPNGTVKISYSQTLTAEGQPAKFTWSISEGSLPPGLTLNPDTGEISGKPTATGKYTFTVSADNDVPKGTPEPATQEYTITINALAITPNPPNGTINEPYTHKFTLNGNTSSNVTWSWAAATGYMLPPQLSLNRTTGEITGTPTETGTYRFNVTATGDDFTETRQFTITINAFSPPVITTADVLYGEVGVNFWEILGVTGNAPIEWIWTDSDGGKGNLPPGLVLSDLEDTDPAKLQYGIISGIPTKAGFYYVSISAISRRGTSEESIGTKNIVIIIRGSINVASITGVPSEATINRQIAIKATVNPIDATYQSIIWEQATMEEIIKNTVTTAPSNTNQWIKALRDLLGNAGITQSSSLLSLNDSAEFILELAKRVGITNIPAGTDLSSLLLDTIIKKAPPYGDMTLTQNNVRKNTSGTVWLKATIKKGLSDNTDGTVVGGPDFVEYFPLQFSGFVPVTNITGIPTEAVAEVPLTLTGEVYPYTATNTTIVWELSSLNKLSEVKLTQAGVLTATVAGDVMVTARIKNGASPETDYVKTFKIKVVASIPVIKVIEPQSNTLYEGTAGQVTYTIETKYIADGIYDIALVNPPAGISLSSVKNIQIKNGKGTLTVHTTSAVLANTYPLSINLTNVKTIDGSTVKSLESNKFACIVGAPFVPTPPTIIRPSELTNGAFPPKEVGGSMGQLYLPNGSMNIQYNETLLTAGFEHISEAGNETTPPTYWRIIGGSLPPGLVITQWIEGTATGASAPTNPQTGIPSSPTGSTGWDTGYARAGAVIEGKPSATGVGKLYTFIVEADEIEYFQRGTDVVWKREGYVANPTAEKITWVYNKVTNTVVFSGKKAVRTINILIEPKIYYPATGLTISPDTLKISLGATETLSATVLSAGTTSPNNIASIQDVTWQTNNPRVATVDAFGNVSGISEGTAIITATTHDKNIIATRTVTVFDIPVTKVNLSKSNMTLTVGGTEILTPTVLPANAINKAVAFDSSNLNVAIVDAFGRITAIGEGVTTITVTTMGIKADGSPATATCKVTVQKTPPVLATKVSINKTVTKLIVGESETLTAMILPENASYKTVTWSSSNPNSVSVDPATGKITAANVTTTPVIITATVDQSEKVVKVECRVTVEAAPVAEKILADKISINKTVTRLIVGESETLKATVFPEKASNKTVTWSSSNPNSVSVDPTTGKMTARAPTTPTAPVIITATVDSSNPIVSVQCRVDVDAVAIIEKVSLNKNAAVVPVGMTEMLTATLTPVQSIEYNRDNLIWRSLDENIATVDSKGNVTGKTVGTTVIEVGTTNGLVDKCAIQVTPLNSVVQTFVDVNSSEWHFSYINQAVSYGLVEGVGKNMFAPDRNVTRAEFVTMVVRLLNLTSKNNTSITFKDVNPGDWYYNYIKVALAEGILTELISDKDNNFYPNRAIRREEMAVILAAAAKNQGLTENLSPAITLATPTNPSMKDKKLITAQYVDEVELVYKLGLMNGYPDGTFDPQGVSTRAQAATVMVRLYHEVARFF